MTLSLEQSLSLLAERLNTIQGLIGSIGGGGGGLTNPMTTQDDIIIGGASGVPTRLAKGSNTQHLAVSAGGHLAWETPTDVGFANPMTTPADLIVGGASGAATRLAKGSDSQVLTIDPVTHLIVWATPTDVGFANPMTTANDIIIGGVSGAAARLAKGTDSQVLTVDPVSHDLAWKTPTDVGFANPMTTPADLIVGGASGAAARLAKGSDGQVLTVDPATHLLVWATPTTGTVTSVGLTVPAEFTAGSAVTGSGNLSFTKAVQAANRIYSGPASGADAAPTFRALVAADLPASTFSSAICQGRLTLTTAVPITTADVTAATTLYFTPFRGNLIGTYSGSAWSVNSFAEKSITLVGLTADKNYDVFIVDGTLALEVLVWTDGVTRATALVLQDGIYVKSGATTRRYLGTIRIIAAGGASDDSVLRRYVWNAYNRSPRRMRAVDTTDTWNYNSATYRQANAAAANKVEYVCGLSEEPVDADVVGQQASTANTQAGGVGVGIDVTNANSAQRRTEVNSVSGQYSLYCSYTGYPGIGYHFLAWLESSRAGTTTFWGDGAVVTVQSGIQAQVWA